MNNLYYETLSNLVCQIENSEKEDKSKMSKEDRDEFEYMVEREYDYLFELVKELLYLEKPVQIKWPIVLPNNTDLPF